MTDAEKLIRKIKSDHKKLLAQYDEAIAAASVGTNTHGRLLEAKSKANERHREELVRFNALPQDLGGASKTEYVYQSFIGGVPANAAELRKLLVDLAQEHFPLDAQLLKACKGLHYSDEDEQIRQELEKDFPCTTKN
jgi:hypothetical protein